MSRPWARFDGLRSGEALRCPPPRRALTAVRPSALTGRTEPARVRGGDRDDDRVPGGAAGRARVDAADLVDAEELAVVSSLRGRRPARLVRQCVRSARQPSR